MNNLLLAFYGDDFTGSTDALEAVSRAGLKAVLFIEPPTGEQLSRYPQLDAIGVAGLTRSLSPEAMENVLQPAFEKLKALSPRHVHYKVCSTFDSSPTVGSIGRAIDVGATIFQSEAVPLLVAAPWLGRYCVFGNLFARMGIGSAGTIHRLDRHPSMSKHPVTPSDESDLRLHLAKQTEKRIGLLDILQLQKTAEELYESLVQQKQEGAEIVLLDAVYDEQLLLLGALLEREAALQGPLFSVGSSGVEMALSKHWNKTGVVKSVQSWPQPEAVSSLLVLSGSRSPVTAGQIEWAKAQGFAEVPLQTQDLTATTGEGLSTGPTVMQIVSLLKEGKSVVVHTGGVDGIAVSESAKILGTALGNVGRKVGEEIKLKRIVVAGGDTSSYAARAMGIEAVEMTAPLAPGAPLCKACAPGSAVDGVEVNFKGGQVGGEDYFGRAAHP